MLTILEPKNQKILDFLKIKDLPTKRYFYSTLDFKETSELTKFDTPDKFWICLRSYKLFPSKDDFFLKQTNYEGLSIENKKIKFWKNENVWKNTSIKNAIIKHFNFNWYSHKLDFMVDKIVLKKMITNKITNNDQIIRYYIKKNNFNCSLSLLKKCINEGKMNYSSINGYFKYMLSCTNQDDFLTLSLKDELICIPNIYDIFKECYILGKKVNLKWSKKRMQEEHTNMTMQLMAIAQDAIEDEIIDIKLEQEIPERFELLNSKKRVFKEGFCMKHCIYTNYWTAIKEKRYVVFHDKKLNVTIGCNIRDKLLIHDQINGKYNTFPHKNEDYNEICQLLSLYDYEGKKIYQTKDVSDRLLF